MSSVGKLTLVNRALSVVTKKKPNSLKHLRKDSTLVNLCNFSTLVIIIIMLVTKHVLHLTFSNLYFGFNCPGALLGSDLNLNDILSNKVLYRYFEKDYFI